MRNFCVVTSHITHPTIRQMPARGLYGNREFHVPFWSMIYEVLKFKLQVSEIEF